MNLERNSKRTAEISALLYKIYNDAIVITGDSSASHFCKIMTISTDALKKDGTMRLPYCFVFEPTMLVALVPEKTTDIHALNRIRQRFVTRYFASGYDKEYPNELYSYQNDVQNAGHLEAYNYWILMKGDEAAFTTWQDANASKWNDFIAWFKTNGLKLDATHKLIRAQLE
ncbi:hypothetical protein [Chryseolinea lacunae]|uniref:Uncharacterized protein n=1 Tax=Chryseolinea lacunae TaxID=2801331 RepID=A0ABS1KKN5_9BACT|nr:hypothetical protein [Chryseolinea lacunae]MBL0740028.1 hypothetical protein [Chryseolinea lacunae]